MTPEQKQLAMAHNVAVKIVPDDFMRGGMSALTMAFREIAQKAALAAIQQTSELAADYCASLPDSVNKPRCGVIVYGPSNAAEPIRQMEHLPANPDGTVDVGEG